MSELERKLCSKLLDSDTLTEAWEAGVRTEQFDDPLYQAVWAFTVSHWQETQAVPTTWTLSQEFPGYIPDSTAQEETIYLADLLRRRKVTNKLQEIVRKASNTTDIDPLGTAKELEAEILALNEITRMRITEADMGQTINARRERYARRAESPQGIGVPYGIDLLDIHTGGIYPGELAIIGAYAKTGKTQMLCNAVRAAKDQRLNPIIFSLELTLDDIQERMDAFWSGLSYDKITRGNLSIDELKILHAKQDELRDEYGGLMIRRPDEDERTPQALVARARMLNADYLIIDQLSKLTTTRKFYSTKEKYNYILSDLKNEISRPGKEIPCFLAVQTRREEGEPSIQSFADAAEVERDCDIAMTLWRSADMYHSGMMKLNIVAPRRCAPAAFLLDWNLTTQTSIRALEEIR